MYIHIVANWVVDYIETNIRLQSTIPNVIRNELLRAG